MKKIVLVYNPKSGSSPSIAVLSKIFKKHNITVTNVIAVQAGFEKKLLPNIDNNSAIAVVGGDGTISSVAGLLAHTEAVLVPLPGGTLNHFTRDLGVAQDIEKAIQKVATAKSQLVDIASVNDTYFINNSSIGLYPHSLETRQGIEKDAGKWPGAVIGTIKAFLIFRTYKISINNRRPFTTPFLFVGNNSYKITDNIITNRTHLNRGILSIYSMKVKTRRAVMKIFVAAVFKKLHDIDEFEAFSSEQIIIIKTRQKRLAVSHDGEVSSLPSPLTYKIHKKALRILI